MKKNELRKWRENYTPFTGICLHEGLKLNVHFEEKDFVKHIGCRWNPDSSGKGGYWWVPVHMLVHRLSEEVPVYVNIFLEDQGLDSMCSGMSVLDWLNLNKMISGEGHGGLNPERCENAISDSVSEDYVLGTDVENSDIYTHFNFFPSLDIVRVVVKDRDTSNNIYQTKEEARVFWDSLVNAGATRKMEMENMNA